MADLGANYGSIPITTQVNVPNALNAGYQMQQQRQAIDTQNALADAVPQLQTDPQNAFATAAAKSPQAALQLLPYIKQASDEKKAQAADAADTLGKTAYSLLTQYKDPMVRKAVALSMAPQLAQHGITSDQIANFDYSDANLQSTVNNSQQVKDLIGQAQKARELDNTAANSAETQRHDKATEATATGNLNVARGNLAVNQKKADQENYSTPTMIGFTGPDGEEKQVAGIYDKKRGQYIDASTMQPIVNPQNLRVIGNATGGGRSMAMAGRVSTAALDASTDIENMSGIGSNGNMGLFTTMANTPLNALGRSLRPQAVQDMQTTMAGLSRAMSLLGSGGMQGSDTIMKSFDTLQPQAGDSQITVMRKLGSFRQQATNGIDAALASPMYSPPQKKQLQAAKDKIERAIPWLPSDVQRLEDNGDSSQSMHDVFSAKAAADAAPVHISGDDDYNKLPSGTAFIGPDGKTRKKP